MNTKEAKMEPTFPNVHVQLSGEDGNAMFIISRTTMALRRAGISREDIERFAQDAMSGDYDHVLQTVMKTVSTS